MPKIVFRDCSIQHISCLIPIYNEMVKQGFNCELQYIEVPRRDLIEEWLQRIYLTKCDCIVTTDFDRTVFAPISLPHEYEYGEFLRNQRSKSIFLFHGVGAEEVMIHHNQIREFKAIFFNGPYWMEVFKDFQGKYLVGYPKLDLLMSNERNDIAIKIRNEMNLPYDKTVMYAPTLRRWDSFDETAPYLLELFKDLEINLLIKTHCDDEDKDYQPSLYQEIKTKSLSMKNVRWIGGLYQDITPLYLISDVVISGCSSVLREFMVVDKPSIQMTNLNPEVAQQLKFSTYTGCIQSSLEDLKKNILHAIYVPEWMHEERQKEIEKHFYKPDGHAAERAANKIKELMEW